MCKSYERIGHQLLEHIETKKTIVYLDFVQDIAPVAIALRQLGATTCSYHGQKMSPNDKVKAMENWTQGEIQVMVCTSAFGMGVNTPGLWRENAFMFLCVYAWCTMYTV